MKLRDFDWPSLPLYVLVSACMYVATGGDPEIEQILATVVAQLAVLWIDLRSYRKGLECGSRITKEVWGIE